METGLQWLGGEGEEGPQAPGEGCPLERLQIWVGREEMD